MKKTITLPDGQTEVIEGTAEEVAQYERAKREEANESKRSKKKVLLTEEKVREIVKEELLAHDLARTIQITSSTSMYTVCQHQYPAVWLGITPPSCVKCGQPMPQLTPYVISFLGESPVGGSTSELPQLDMTGQTIPCAVGGTTHLEKQELSVAEQFLFQASSNVFHASA